MKPYCIEVNESGKRAGPVTEHVGNFMLRLFDRVPNVHTVEVFSSLSADAPRARYVRSARGVVWYAPVKSRRLATHRTVTDKVSGEVHRVRLDHKVHQSPLVGQWVEVGVVTYTEPDPLVDRPSTVTSESIITDIIEHPYIL